jgi:hypothetical protein
MSSRPGAATETSLAAPPPLKLGRAVAEVLEYLAHPESLLALSVLALILGVAEWLGDLPSGPAAMAHPTARLLWACYFFLVARKAALGSRRLPIPSDHLDTYDTLLQPLMQGLAATAISWGALLVLAASSTGVNDFLFRYHGHPLMFMADQGLP